MKKLLAVAIFASLFAFSRPLFAYGSGLELSGHINTGLGFQANANKAVSALGGVFVEEGMLAADPTGAGAQTGLSNNVTWVFYVGDAELDISKAFGENIRLRADIDFIRDWSNGYHSAFAADRLIEQAYATVNIPMGHGMEFLVGRFNAPMGFEAVDNNDNLLPFHSLIFNFLRPVNLTGIKFYYPFSDHFDLHLWGANNLRDIPGGVGPSGNADSGELPAAGARLGFAWGASTLGISGAAGSEARQNDDFWGDWSYLGDIDFNIWVSDVLAIGGEGIFRRDSNRRPPRVAAGKDNMYYGGIVNFNYLFSDVWSGVFQYTYVVDHDGSDVAAGNINAPTVYSGDAEVNYTIASDQYHSNRFSSALQCKGQFHQFDFGMNYYIADGAKVMIMYRFDMTWPDKAGTARTNLTKMGQAHSLAANFAYEF